MNRTTLILVALFVFFAVACESKPEPVPDEAPKEEATKEAPKADAAPATKADAGKAKADAAKK